MKEQRTWLKGRKKKGLRILAGILSFCVLVTTCLDMPVPHFVSAAEETVRAAASEWGGTGLQSVKVYGDNKNGNIYGYGNNLTIMQGSTEDTTKFYYTGDTGLIGPIDLSPIEGSIADGFRVEQYALNTQGGKDDDYSSYDIVTHMSGGILNHIGNLRSDGGDARSIQFFMSGGTLLTENTAFAAHVVDISGNSVIKGSAFIFGSFSISDSPQIGGEGKGICITSGATFTVKGALSGASIYVNPQADFADGTKIAQAASGYTITASDLAQMKLTGSYVEGKELYLENNAIYIRVKPAVPSHSHAEISFDTVLTAGGTLNSGNYYLDSDINSSITIKGTVNLCLNGHTLQSGTDNIVTVGSGATLNLYDCGASGNITGHRIQSRPGAVVYVTGGTFNMYGGTVKDSWIQSANGGGVYVNSGTFNMYGGTISGNQNQSGKGGGVYVDNGTFHMSGGTISGNSGYGVYIDNGSFTVSGAPRITGNSSCNVYLNSGKTITITDALSDIASIGVKTKTLPSDGSPVAITGTNSADYSHCFFSDTKQYEIQNSGSGSSQVVQLVMPHKHSFTYSAGGAVITESCSCGHSETAVLSVVSDADLTYTGSAIEACRVTYSDGWKGGTLTLNYSDHINAGTAKAAISKNGETASLDFTINAKSLTDSMISGLSPAYEWTGNAVMPSVTVKDGGKTLEGDTDYILSYAGNINIGNNTATVTIKGVGNYTGSITKIFTIYKNWNVILHSGGGSGTDLTVYEQGTGVTLPADWTREGYIFEGWYDNESCSGAEVKEISATATGDKEYWAKWTDNIAPVIGTLQYSYQPKNFWQWLIGKDSLVITVPVTEEGSGADEINYIVTPEGGTEGTKTAAIRNGVAEITVSADFKGTISITCTDKANNKSVSVTVGAGLNATGIIIEDNAPAITFKAENAELLPSGEYKTVPDIAVTVADDKDNAVSAGIASVIYQIDSGSEKTVDHNYMTGMVLNDSFTIPANEIPAGGAVISVTATDNAGNSVTKTYTVKMHTHSVKQSVPEKEASCTDNGNKAYVICSCGKYFSDSTCTTEMTEQETVTEAKGHDFTGKYIFDKDNHWQECSRCVATSAKESHQFEADGIHCTKCELEKAGEGHTHSIDADGVVPGKSATCTKAGRKEYYKCSCGTWFFDSAGTDEITDQSKIVIAALGHDFSGTYQHDENDHWKKCSRCEETQPKEEHIYDNAADRDCNVCGYERSIGDTGMVSKDVEKDEKAPNTTLSTSADELADIVLTEEEKAQVENGTDIKFILNVKDIGDTVNISDKAVVQAALSGNTEVKGFVVGQYLDISLFKIIGTERSAISQTAKRLTIVIDVPDSLKSKDSTKPRTFAIVRVHDGVAETLADLDNGSDTITIATDRFSAYAIVYKEAGDGEDVKPSPTPGGSVKPSPTPGGSIKPTPPPIEETEKASIKEKRKMELHSGLKAVQTGKKLQISWGRVTGADGYSVFVQYCGKNFRAKPLKQVKGGKKTKLIIKKVNGRKLDTTKNYKSYVVAWRWKNGKKSTLAKTLTVHIAGKDSVKYTNVKSIKMKKTSYSLKKGGTVTLRPKVVLYNKKKKQLSVNHTKEFRYLSSNKKVATVTAGGKVKAKETGTCTIYVFAKNGCKRKIKIKVKK